MKNYALRFISGKYQGGEYTLPSDTEIIVGRSSELDMVLVEDMVSRRHAKMYVKGDQIIIQDLGSTNGTFVNGERIKRARLNEGDRILIGTSIIKLVTVAAAPASDLDPNTQLEQMAAHRRTGQMRSMSGDVNEIPLPDLLQLFGSSKKTGTLVIRTEKDVGKVYLDEGGVIYASINDSEELTPTKCLYRIMTWRNGTFYMEPTIEQNFEQKLELSTEGSLMESMRIFDEVNRLGPSLPSMETTLSLVSPLKSKLSDLNSDELTVLQYAMNLSVVESIFNNCPLDDIEIGKILITLLDKDYLTVIEDALIEIS